MIYRIDLQHFLTHMIDYFTRDELLHFQYAIISASIPCQYKAKNASKINPLYPTVEIIENYAQYQDKKIMEKMYLDLLKPEKINPKEDNWAGNNIYRTFINTLLKHDDVIILCDKGENDYIDVLCKHLKDEYAIEVINLNELFEKGKIGPIYIDRKEIHNKAVDIRRSAANQMIKSMETTEEGRMNLLKKMNEKNKRKKLKELGLNVSKDEKNLDAILIDAWVRDEEED